MDHLTKSKRSWNMSRIRSKDTKPELIIRKMLHNSGIRYRLHVSDLPGKPDISNKKKGFAIFVNGCFWHQHEGCKRATVPKSNKEYWIPKLEKNIERQKDNINSILNMGMKSYIVWECEVKDIKIEELLDA
tara:strand:+ start:309 stop:701 length:393 start_codon:yes stop_codon:yes gene_type:complete